MVTVLHSSAPRARGPRTRRGERMRLATHTSTNRLTDPEAERAATLNAIDVRSAALTVVAAIAVVMVLKTAAAMIIPIVLSVLISYALDPMVGWLQRFRAPRRAAAALVLVALVAGTGGLLYGLRFEAAAIVDKLPQAAHRVRQAFERGGPISGGAIQQVQNAATELERAADAAAAPPPAPSGVTRVQVESPPLDISDYLIWGS